jgi:hypothetical protein
MPKPRIMYIENKSATTAVRPGLVGPACIGRVSFSKTGKSLYYGGKTFQSLKGSGFKANYFDVDTHDEYGFLAQRKMARTVYTARVPPQ